MGQWFSPQRLVIVVSIALSSVFGTPLLATSFVGAAVEVSSEVNSEVDADAESDLNDEAPAELPLSEDEGTAAFWVNVRRFVLVIALVAGLFTLWSKIERNRAADSRE